jgi:hypothetical protein
LIAVYQSICLVLRRRSSGIRTHITGTYADNNRLFNIETI